MRRRIVELVVAVTLLTSVSAALAAAPARIDGGQRIERSATHQPHVAALLRDRAGETLDSIVVLRPSAENEVAAKVALFRWRSGAADLLVSSDLGGGQSGANRPRRSFTLSVDPEHGRFTFQRAAKSAVQSSSIVSPIDGGDGGGFSGSVYNVNGYLDARTGRGYPAGGLTFYAEWQECPSGRMTPNIFYGDCSGNPEPGITGDILALVGCRRDQPYASSDGGADLFIGRVTATYVGSRYWYLGTTALSETLQGEGYASFGGTAYLRWSYSHSDPDGYPWPAPIHYSESQSFPGGAYCPDSTGGGGGGGTGGGGTGGGTGGGDSGSGGTGGGGGWGCATVYDGLTFEVLGVCCGTTAMIVDCAEGYL